MTGIEQTNKEILKKLNLVYMQLCSLESGNKGSIVIAKRTIHEIMNLINHEDQKIEELKHIIDAKLLEIKDFEQKINEWLK